MGLHSCPWPAVVLGRPINGSWPLPACSQEVALRAGWFNLLGQAADTASINYMIANQIASMWLLSTGHPFTQLQLLACYTSACTPVSSRHVTVHVMHVVHVMLHVIIFL